jgi:hypothetical protein
MKWQLKHDRIAAQVVSARFHGGEPGLRPGQSMWDLWYTKCHSSRYFSDLFDLLQAKSFCCSIFTHESFGGWTTGLFADQVHRNVVSAPSHIKALKTLERSYHLDMYCAPRNLPRKGHFISQAGKKNETRIQRKCEQRNRGSRQTKGG